MDECMCFLPLTCPILIDLLPNSNYVDQETAVAKNLTFAECDTLVLRADDTTILDPNGPGRDSVRIRSVKTYTTHVAMYVTLASWNLPQLTALQLRYCSYASRLWNLACCVGDR